MSVAAHSLNATYESRLPLAVYLVGAALTVALSFAFVITRDVRAASPAAEASGSLAAGDRSGAGSRRSVSWPGSGSSPRALPAARATATSRPCSCGSTAGSESPSCRRSSGRSGSSSTRSRRSMTSAQGSCVGSGSRAGIRRSTPPASVAGRRPSGSAFFVWLELVLFAGSRNAVRGHRRVHRVHPRDDGPVRARRRGDRRARPSRSGSGCSGGSRRSRSSTRTGASGAARSASGLLERGWSWADVTLVGFAVGVDPVRRPVADADVLRPVRRSGPADQHDPAPRLPRDHRRGGWAVARIVGLAATGAGLLPIAVGYLIAHYFTYLLIDGQRILDRHLGPVPAWLGPLRDRVPRAQRRFPAARGWCGPSSLRPSSAGTCSARGVVTSWPPRRRRPGWTPPGSGCASCPSPS